MELEGEGGLHSHLEEYIDGPTPSGTPAWRTASAKNLRVASLRVSDLERRMLAAIGIDPEQALHLLLDGPRISPQGYKERLEHKR